MKFKEHYIIEQYKKQMINEDVETVAIIATSILTLVGLSAYAMPKMMNIASNVVDAGCDKVKSWFVKKEKAPLNKEVLDIVQNNKQDLSKLFSLIDSDKQLSKLYRHTSRKGC